MGVCPKFAIGLSSESELGFYKPKITESKCINCGLCLAVCPLDKNQGTAKGKDVLVSFFGWSRSPENRAKSSSGAIAFELGKRYSELGYQIIGCFYDEGEKISIHDVLTHENIATMRGSKYFQSNTSAAMIKLRKMDKREKVVFFGTPCQIAGFQRAASILGFRPENLLMVEIFCHGITSPALWKRYIDQIETKIDGKIRKTSFRTKHYGWHIPCNQFSIEGTKGPRILTTKRSGDPFFDVYYSQKVFNRNCYHCSYKKTFARADLRIGDFWGKRFSNNSKGVSCIIACSQKGIDALQSAKDVIEFYSVDMGEALAGQSLFRDPPFDEQTRFKISQLLQRNSTFSQIQKVVFSDMKWYNKAKKSIRQFISNHLHRK